MARKVNLSRQKHVGTMKRQGSVEAFLPFVFRKNLLSGLIHEVIITFLSPSYTVQTDHKGT